MARQRIASKNPYRRKTQCQQENNRRSHEKLTMDLKTLIAKTAIDPELTLLNKTGTSQVGAISKAQKAQNIFLEKKLEIFDKKILSQNVAQCRKM